MVSETMVLRGAGGAARMIGLLCVADSKLGEFGEGQCPVTRTGDYSDVVVVDADSRIIPWQRVARLDRTEMERTMREIVDRLYTYLSEHGSGGAGRAPETPGGRNLAMEQAEGESGSEEAARGDRKRHRRERREAGSGLRRRTDPAAVVAVVPGGWKSGPAAMFAYLFGPCEMSAATRRAERWKGRGFPRHCMTPVATAPATRARDASSYRCNASRPRLVTTPAAWMWNSADCYAITDLLRATATAPAKPRPAAGLTAGLLPVWMLHRV